MFVRVTEENPVPDILYLQHFAYKTGLSLKIFKILTLVFFIIFHIFLNLLKYILMCYPYIPYFFIFRDNLPIQTHIASLTFGVKRKRYYPKIMT